MAHMIKTRSTGNGTYAVFIDGKPVGLAQTHHKRTHSYCGFVLNKECGGDGSEWHFGSLKELRAELPEVLLATRAA